MAIKLLQKTIIFTNTADEFILTKSLFMFFNVMIWLHILHNHLLVNIRLEAYKKSQKLFLIWYGINMLICKFGGRGRPAGTCRGIETMCSDRFCSKNAFIKYMGML